MKAVEGRGDDSGGHMANFLTAVRSRKVEDLNADVAEGATSAILVHMANISYRLGTQQPFNSLTGIIGVQTGDGAGNVAGSGVGPVLGGASGVGGFTGLIICSANMPDKIAIAVDTQMDDGAIDKGTVRGQAQTTTNPDIATAASATAYAETGTNVYTICRAL